MMLRSAILATWATAVASAALSAEGDAERGEALFQQCAACHQIGAGAVDRSGPALNGIVGKPAAAIDGFRYSTALRRLAEDGLVWNTETLDAFLADPRGYVRGTRMSFRGITEAQDRADLIAFLMAADTRDAASGFDVSPEILAIKGDAAYGEYLAGECTACHSSGGDIPRISGMDPDTIVVELHAYRAGAREHQVMQLVTGRLGDEEIAALAAYFGALE